MNGFYTTANHAILYIFGNDSMGAPVHHVAMTQFAVALVTYVYRGTYVK